MVAQIIVTGDPAFNDGSEITTIVLRPSSGIVFLPR
jgi:hypothetical protein